MPTDALTDRRRLRSRLIPAALAVGCLAVGLWWPAGAVLADPPGPTDFQSEVVSIVPESPTITLDVVGGDAFVRLRVDPGTTVQVVGYFGEPYLAILPDGSVQQNRRSPSVALNENRYGTSPADAVVGTAEEIAAAVPEWEVIGSGGEYLWHDHRVHLMTPDPPSGTLVGATVSDQTIRMAVNGVPVEARVISVLQPAPSRTPLVAGVIVATFAALVLLSKRWRQAWLLIGGGAAAAAIGWWQHGSVPISTEPSNLLFVLPALAASCGVIALSFGRNMVASVLVLLGGLQLGVWVYLRRDGLVRSVLPTDAPFWLDRAVTAGAGVVAVVAVLAGGIALFRLPSYAAPAPPSRQRATAKTSSTPPRGGKSSGAAPVTTWGRKRPSR